MKYIRTNKDKIYCITDKESLKLKKENPYFFKIIKESDNLEELCDCYSYDTETTRDVAVACSWKLHNKEREIFGCIKTDKGLIYVAKMNDKGGLELL